MTLKRTVDTKKLLPISLFQRLMVLTTINPDTKAGFFERLTLRMAFRMQPKLPMRRVQRAFDKLVARHDSLRLRFVEDEGEWKAEILPEHARGLIFEDLSHLTASEQDAIILERGLAPISALSDSLFEVTVLHCGEGGDVFLIRANHAIMDGHSIALIVEELLKFALNMPLLGKPLGHIDYITLNRKRLTERVEEKEAFWKAKILPIPDDPNIGRKAKGLPSISPQTLGTTISTDNILTDAEAAQLAARVKKSRVSAYSMFHAAFSETICEMSDQTEFIILTVLGRKEAALSGFVGTDVHPLFVKYQSNPGHLMERASWVAQQIAEGSENLPTVAFYPGSELSEAFLAKSLPRARFRVHIAYPTGRLSSSPFSKLFGNSMEGKVTIGFGSSERIDLPGTTDTDCEIDFLIHQTKAGPNASLVADAAAFSHSELLEMAAIIKKHLELV